MKKQLLIATMAVLVFASCGKKEETPVSNSGNDSSAQQDNSSQQDSSSEARHNGANPYFLQDSIWVPVEVTFSDSDYIINYEYNDKGWLTVSHEKTTDYDLYSELIYKEDGNIVNVTYKESLYDPEYEPEDASVKADSDGYIRSESKLVILNDDGTNDKYEGDNFGTVNIAERDYKGRATVIEYSERNQAQTDAFSGVINYSAEAMTYEELDSAHNSKGLNYYTYCHIPVFATRVSTTNLPVLLYDGKVTIGSDGTITGDPENGIEFSYDDNKRLVLVSQGEDILNTFTYNNDGKLAKQTDANGGIETEYTYDENGNISEIHIQSDDSGIIKIKYEKVPLSMAGLCSYWIIPDTYVPDFTDYNLLWNVPYQCFYRYL